MEFYALVRNILEPDTNSLKLLVLTFSCLANNCNLIDLEVLR
jgi:hypothetical protein